MILSTPGWFARAPCRNDLARCPERARQCARCPHRAIQSSASLCRVRATTRSRTHPRPRRLRELLQEQPLLAALCGCLCGGLAGALFLALVYLVVFAIR